MTKDHKEMNKKSSLILNFDTLLKFNKVTRIKADLLTFETL